jgi:hypothetical protein
VRTSRGPPVGRRGGLLAEDVGRCVDRHRSSPLPISLLHDGTSSVVPEDQDLTADADVAVIGGGIVSVGGAVPASLDLGRAAGARPVRRGGQRRQLRRLVHAGPRGRAAAPRCARTRGRGCGLIGIDGEYVHRAT